MSELAQFANFYRGKTVFLTGHTGFKGAWLVVWLHSLGARVIGYALDAPSQPSLFDRLELTQRIVDIRGDVRDGRALQAALSQHKPEIVFHLAAQSLVRPSYTTPVETFDTNVMGTVNVLEAVRHCASVRACVMVTSDKCYENREWVYAYRENDAMGGFDPYSASKGAAELVVASYRNSFFNPQDITRHGISVASVRAGNVIGGGDWAVDRIIPDSVRALSGGQSIAVRNPHAIRPWQHVLEPLSGYLLLAMRMWDDPARFAQAWNFGPSAAANVNVATIVQYVIREWRSGQWQDASQGQRAPHEATFLRLDCTKAANLLGWAPVYSVSESIRETIKWYFGHYNDRGFKPFEFSLQQINDYVKQATAAQPTL